MKLDEETKEKIDKLPIVLKSAANYLIDVLDNIINGNCNEDTLVSTMSTINNNTNKRISNDDVVNYDKAGDILGFSNNPSGLKKLLDKNGIKQVVINNQKCGFLRSEVVALKDKLVKRQNRKQRTQKSKEEKEALRIKKIQEERRIREEVKRRRFI